jgi:hypothetical protein
MGKMVYPVLVWEVTCDGLRCDMRSCRTSHISSLRCKDVRLIGNGSNDAFQSGSDGKCLQMPRHMLMTANWRLIIRVRRFFTAHQSGATSDCCEYIMCLQISRREADSCFLEYRHCVCCIGDGHTIIMLYTLELSEASIEVSA